MHITLFQGAFIPLPPHGGGAVEKLWLKLGEQFAAKGHKVTMISRRLENAPERARVEGFDHIYIRGFDTPGSIVTLKFLDLVYTRRALSSLPDADIIVTNTFWAPLLLPKRAGRIVVDVQRMPKGQLKLYSKASKFRANSSAVLNAIREENPKYESKTVVVPNPLPFDTNVLGKEPEKENRILYTGRVHEEKGIKLLLSAFSTLISKGDLGEDWHLDIVGPADVGSGGGGSKYLDDLQTGFTHPNIHWHGAINETGKLNSYYKKSKIFIYPSLAEKGETFGLSPLEAMSWGCSTIVSDLACFKDFILHGVNGLIFDHRCEDPSSALKIQILAIANGNYPELSQNAIKVRDSHSSDRISEQFLTLFNEILDAS